MSFDYADLAATASDLLAEFGKSITLKQKITTGYDPTTGRVGNAGTFDSVINAAFFDFPPNQTMYRGQAVQGEDQRVLMEAVAGVVPQPGDLLVDGTIKSTIISVDPNGPAGVIVVYDCHVRR